MEKFKDESQSSFSKLGWEKFPLFVFIFPPDFQKNKKRNQEKTCSRLQGSIL